MSNIEEIVDSLEKKINVIVRNINDLKHDNLKLEQELAITKQEIETQKRLNVGWEDKYNTLKTANSLLGSNDNKRETKFKINALIKEIDHCIAQLTD